MRSEISKIILKVPKVFTIQSYLPNFFSKSDLDYRRRGGGCCWLSKRGFAFSKKSSFVCLACHCITLHDFTINICMLVPCTLSVLIMYSYFCPFPILVAIASLSSGFVNWPYNSDTSGQSWPCPNTAKRFHTSSTTTTWSRHTTSTSPSAPGA